MALPKLWPKADYQPWFAPRAVENAEREYGKGLDRGALRETEDGKVEILWGQNTWVPFQEGKRGHLSAANAFARLGPGWAGGHHPETMHASGDGYYEQVTGKKPDPLLAFDLNFNEKLFREWQRKANGADDGGGDGGTDRPTQLDRIETMLKELLARPPAAPAVQR